MANLKLLQVRLLCCLLVLIIHINMVPLELNMINYNGLVSSFFSRLSPEVIGLEDCERCLRFFHGTVTPSSPLLHRGRGNWWLYHST